MTYKRYSCTLTDFQGFLFVGSKFYKSGYIYKSALRCCASSAVDRFSLWLSWNSRRSACLCLCSAGIKGMGHHYTRLLQLLKTHFCSAPEILTQEMIFIWLVGLFVFVCFEVGSHTARDDQLAWDGLLSNRGWS